MVKLIAVFCLFLAGEIFAEEFNRYNNVTRYDHYFSKYTKRNFGPAFNWHRFKAQAIAESALKKNAKSQVGAIGLMQIMPATYEEITKRHRFIKGNSNSPKWNIAAGIAYNRSIWNLFKAERPFQDRLNFTYGAYNAGKGNIIKAQKKAKSAELDPNLWRSIELTLPKITGKNSEETLTYVKKIQTIKQVLK
ncbi:MAG: transglycosylase SLT domain-containing protein [Alteromonadaceae bacterium]|nr:transglycosylase SLT domain-containing protein [Alteromonadaceae bacterium]